MTKDQIVQKITSRKFLIALAAFIATFGTCLTSQFAGHEWATIVALCCSTAVAFIYIITEGKVDAANTPNTATVPDVLAKLEELLEAFKDSNAGINMNADATVSDDSKPEGSVQ